MKKVLVTGANGQLGCEMKKIHLIFPIFQVEFTDVDTLDLTDQHAVDRYFEANHFGYLINCAAYTAVDKAETEPEKAFRINAEVPGMLQQICSKNHCQLIHLSTDYVFDGNACMPYIETVPASPQSVYGKSKLAGELEVLKNPENIVIRSSWLYAAQGANFLKTMLRLGKERESLNVVFDQVGTPTSAADLAGAILTICSQLVSTGEKAGGIYHYSNEGVCSWYDFAVDIMEMAGLNCKVIPITSDQYPSPTKRPAYSVLNKAKIKVAFGLEIPHWRKSLETVVKTI
jgi:dTDP-4-dehydrorhamnose reductase